MSVDTDILNLSTILQSLNAYVLTLVSTLGYPGLGLVMFLENVFPPMVLVGIALCLSSLIAWIAVGVLIATCLLRISREEKQLIQTYGKAFEAYRSQTHWAYLPGVF